MNVEHIGRTLEQIFSRFQRAMPVQVVPQQKSMGIVNDSCGFQFVGNAAGGVSGMKQNEFLTRGSDRSVKGPGEPSAKRQDRQQKKCDQCAHEFWIV